MRMVELEDLAIKRDKRFLLRLVLLLLAGMVGGAFLYAKMTSTAVGDCAASTFGNVSGSSPEDAQK